MPKKYIVNLIIAYAHDYLQSVDQITTVSVVQGRGTLASLDIAIRCRHM